MTTDTNASRTSSDAAPPSAVDASSRERGGGSVSAPMATLVLAAALMIGLTIDGVRAAQGLARADAVAEEAARAAGQALDPLALAAGRPAVDPVAAADAARAYLAAAGTTETVTGTVDIIGSDRIRVDTTLVQPTVVLGLIGRTELTSTGSAEAVLVTVNPDGTTDIPAADPGDIADDGSDELDDGGQP